MFFLPSLSDMAEAELAEADQGAIQSGEEEGREEAPQHYLLPEVWNVCNLVSSLIKCNRAFSLCGTLSLADHWCSMVGELRG